MAIVDDVHTTGATIQAFVMSQRAHGVARIGVVVAARVIGNHHLSRCRNRRTSGMASIEMATGIFAACARAEQLLSSKVLSSTHQHLGGRAQGGDGAALGGRTTVPQIFIDGRHIGGSDDLFDLDFQQPGCLTGRIDRPTRS